MVGYVEIECDDYKLIYEFRVQYIDENFLKYLFVLLIQGQFYSIFLGNIG